eukprot:TRINITY_DN5588_c0_g3_i1.p1 TRINITY_DN5588_c0_g3~~TRINITY_DN5588_c0_g3_i1.p1  ORF type:complete len:289 (+),score=20.46 TRINITY_DN5588_c0_g3_i1:170-1036(+)
MISNVTLANVLYNYLHKEPDAKTKFVQDLISRMNTKEQNQLVTGGDYDVHKGLYEKWIEKNRIEKWDCVNELTPEGVVESKRVTTLPVKTDMETEIETMNRPEIRNFFQDNASGTGIMFYWDNMNNTEKGVIRIDLILSLRSNHNMESSCGAIEFKKIGELTPSTETTEVNQKLKMEARRGMSQLITYAQIKLSSVVNLPYIHYCALSDFERIIFVKFVAHSEDERRVPSMFISETYSFHEDTELTVRLLRGFYQRMIGNMSSSVGPIPVPRLSYLDKPFDFLPLSGR